MKKLTAFLMLFFPLMLVAQQTKTIRGKVVAEDGIGLPGASVYIDKNTIGAKTDIDGVVQNFSLGTTTDLDGNFSLDIPSGINELKISYLGYETLSISVVGKSFVTIQMKEEENLLDEVVVTGYQKIEKRKMTSAVASIKAQDIIQSGVAGIDQMLQGQTAGVMVAAETGSPGQLSNIRIRGTASLNASQDPLWVLDGMPLEGNEVPDLSDKNNLADLRNYSIAGVNPDDIESITVLKDASATAIYGARAANGVILVTTKSGRKGKMNVSVRANTFVNFMPDYSRINLMDANQKVDFELGLARRTDLSYRTDNGSVVKLLSEAGELAPYQNTGVISSATLAQIDNLRQNGTNWWRELYRTSINKQYTASVSGGSDMHDYYFSAGYYNEEGSLKDDGFDRINLSLKNTFKVSEKLKIGVTLIGTSVNKKSYLTDANAFTNPNFYSRNVNPYQTVNDAFGNYEYDTNIGALVRENADFVKFNIIEERNNTRNELKSLQLKGVFDLEYKIGGGFSYSTLFGIQLENNNTERWASEDSYFNRSYRAGTRYFSGGRNQYWLPEGSILQNYKSDFFQYMWRNSLAYDKVFGRHDLNLLGGTEIRRDITNATQTRTFGLNDRTLTSIPVIFRNSTDANNSLYLPFRKTELENAYVSFFGTASYTFDNRYTLFGSVRYDGSNLFGVDPKYKYLPIWAISGAWNVRREAFAEGVLPEISTLKLRGSYGFQGNIDRSSSPFVVGTFGTASIIPGTTEEVITVTSPPNNRLRWEKTENVGFGVDLGLFSDRISATFDWYNRLSSDLITSRQLPLETGFLLTPVNYGELTNRGVEFSVTTRNIDTKDWSWATSFNISRNKNTINKVQFNNNRFLPSGEGYPVDAVWTVPYAGLDTDGLPTFFDVLGNVVSAVDFYKLTDPYALFMPGYMVTSSLTEDEARALFQYRGSRSPKWYGGLSSHLRYKDFELDIAGTFSIKRTVLAQPLYNFTRVDPGLNYPTAVSEAWTAGNPTENPRIIGRETIADGLVYNWYNGNDPANTYYAFDNLAKDLSYLRITSIRLGYGIPKEYLKNTGISNFKIALEGRNLFVFSNGHNGYFDPETYGNIYAQPIQKSVALSLNLEF